MNPNEQPIGPQPQPLNPNAQPFVPQPQQQPLNPNAQPFVPQQQPLNPNAQPFVPQPQQQPLNPNAQPFVPQQQPLNPNAQPFVPQPQPALPYPAIADNTPVNPALLNQIINLPPAMAPYQIIGQWHLGFEIWAYLHGFNNGNVAHFNVQAPNGPMLHVYYNGFGQLQVVGIGQTPNGY